MRFPTKQKKVAFKQCGFSYNSTQRNYLAYRTKIRLIMSSEHMECSECGATMLLDNDKIMLVCPFCGNREPLALMRGFNKDYNR